MEKAEEGRHFLGQQEARYPEFAPCGRRRIRPKVRDPQMNAGRYADVYVRFREMNRFA
jgi:hypothetical protein